MRNYHNLDRYLDRLLPDIYPQPSDEGHTEWAKSAYQNLVRDNLFGLEDAYVHNVLDVGCGDTAFMKPIFEYDLLVYTGIALKKESPAILNMDFNFIDYLDNSFDLVWARHSLEHSPMPILTLMEWHRVSDKYLCLINPDPSYWGWVGRNHYSVANREQLRFWLDLAGWEVMYEDETEPKEIRFLCKKKGN